MSNATILCLSHSADFYNIDLVCQSLTDLGYQAVRLNCDTFPSQSQLSYRINSNRRGHYISINDMVGNNTKVSQTITSNDIVAVWLRKNCLPRIDLNNANGEQHEFLQQCIHESEQAKNLMLSGLDQVPWIDPLENILRGENKGLQLRYAIDTSLAIPDTLISNCPEQVRQFYNDHQGKIVTKMLTPLVVSMGRPSAFVYTSRILPEHLDQLDGLRYAPMVFQNEIEKAYELRIIYVNGQCFTGKIDTLGAAEKTRVDWRQSGANEYQWQSYTLPDNIVSQLSQFMRLIGLSFGAIDMIVTPEGQYVFLEVNPCGEWGMLQKFLNLPIAQAIAQALDKKVSEQRDLQAGKGNRLKIN